MSRNAPELPALLKGSRVFVAVLAAFVLLLTVGRAIAGFYIEILWQAEAGYLSLFWRRLAWEWGVRGVAALIVGVLVFVNLRIAATTLGGIQIRRRFGNLEISERIPKRLVTLLLAGSAVLIGLWFGGSVSPGHGWQALLAVSSGPWGIEDPILSRDAGFYVFWYPVLGAALTFALITTFLLFTLATAGYAATGALSWMNGQLRTHPLARTHLAGLLIAFLVLLAVQLTLGRYELLLNGNSGVQGIFGFTDAQARLPALQTLAAICLVAAGLTFWGARRDSTTPVLFGVGGVMVGTLLLGNVVPSLVQSFRVEPNELERETPYIEYSLDFTRLGFGIHDLARDTFAFDASAPIDWEEASEQFAGLPVWGSGANAPILTTYNEVEARFQYYEFDRVHIDRYPTPNGPEPVTISVRHVDQTGIPIQSWQNLHLRERYVSGEGAVVSLATSRTPEGRPQMLVRGLPPEVDAAASITSLELERPDIFYGALEQGRYAVVTPGADQFLAPDSTRGLPGRDFPEGIQLTGLLRTAVLAWEFSSANLLFSTELTAESRFLHRRQVTERAAAIAPFLRYYERPYPVIHEGRVVWILDAFVGTGAFPLSARYEIGRARRVVNYIRNSVKVTIDAVTGEVAFYRVPIEDPLTDAYEAAYPGLLRGIEEMPSGLRQHLRFPRSMLDLQGAVLRHYHQETAAIFHGQQDVWLESEELSNGPQAVPYVPEYGIYRLPGEQEARFQLTTVFVPAGRENLTAILAARTDDAGAPELRLVELPVTDQVRGPRQIEALAEQDPEISQQFSLWRTGGSQVWTGHLHVVPVGNRLLYMEPVFLAAEDDAIPDLTRFVVSDGLRVVMTETLTQAIARMAGMAPELAPILDAADPPPTTAASTVPTDPARWPAAALTLLQQAEDRARAGDWQGYGEALDDLRALLQRLQSGGE